MIIYQIGKINYLIVVIMYEEYTTTTSKFQSVKFKVPKCQFDTLEYSMSYLYTLLNKYYDNDLLYKT